MNNTDKNNLPLLWRLLLLVILSTLAAGLAYAVLSLPAQAPGLSIYTDKYLHSSGVSNPVTAVLLNYRAYDTFLELSVLLLALLGVWSLASADNKRLSSAGPVLDSLSRVLAPLLILVAGYILWAGAHAPGGAFQAGAVLGAAGVLLLLAGWRIKASFAGMLLRISLVIGLVVFAIVGVVLILPGGQFLTFPAAYAGGLILLIETVATLSIAISLVAFFLGGEPVSVPEPESSQILGHGSNQGLNEETGEESIEKLNQKPNQKPDQRLSL